MKNQVKMPDQRQIIFKSAFPRKYSTKAFETSKSFGRHEGLNGVVAITVIGLNFGSFTAIGYFFPVTVNNKFKN